MSNPSHYTEQELISSLQGGEESAFGYLYDHYGAAMYGVILRILPQREVAEDVLQETFVKIYHNIKNYDASRGKLYTWLISITRNTAIDMLRSKDFKKSKQIHELDTVVDSRDDGNSNQFVDSIGLGNVLKELSDDHKEIIDLAYYKGYTQEEISGRLRIPLGTVKSRVRSALMRLRKILKIS